MSTGFGERLTDNVASPNTGRAYLSPPASAAWLAGGRPIDAGTAMIVQSNQFHEVFESVRQLATTLGDGAIIAQGADGWDGLSDGTRPNAGDAATTPNLANAISWSQKQSLKFGPHFVPQDAPDTLNPGQYLARAIRFDVEAVQTSGTLALYLALTASNAPPDLGYVAIRAFTAVTGHNIWTLQPLAPLPAVGMPFACRNATLGASTQSLPTALWAWVGYRGNAADLIIAASLWEVRT